MAAWSAVPAICRFCTIWWREHCGLQITVIGEEMPLSIAAWRALPASDVFHTGLIQPPAEDRRLGRPAQAPPTGAFQGQQGSGLGKQGAGLLGLGLEPPQHAAVFCAEETRAMEALDRLDPALPRSPGRLERHGFHYDGALSL